MTLLQKDTAYTEATEPAVYAGESVVWKGRTTQKSWRRILRPAATRWRQAGLYATSQCSSAQSKGQVPLIDTGTGLPGYEPETLEEQIICYADKFYSKSSPDHVRSVQETAQSLEKFGHAGVVKFLEWAKQFE